MLRSDIEGLKHYSEVLGVGPLYGLFACMVTGRSWEAINTGIAKETTANEVSYVVSLGFNVIVIIDRKNHNELENFKVIK